MDGYAEQSGLQVCTDDTSMYPLTHIYTYLLGEDAPGVLHALFCVLCFVSVQCALLVGGGPSPDKQAKHKPPTTETRTTMSSAVVSLRTSTTALPSCRLGR
jgi:hypothetical protein